MIAMIALVLQVATPAPAPAPVDPVAPETSVTEQVVGTAGTSVVSQLPSGKDWLAMTPQARRLHAVISIEALKLNPSFKKCTGLTPVGFEDRMGRNAAADPASTTITITALTVYELCPPNG